MYYDLYGIKYYNMFLSRQPNIANKLFIQRLIGNNWSSLKLIEQHIIILCKYNTCLE